jgi:hypothetical protein
MSGYRALPDTRRAQRKHSRAHFRDTSIADKGCFWTENADMFSAQLVAAPLLECGPTR